MKSREVPMRRCIGCMESKDKSELLRIAGYEGKLTVDPSGRAKGRGAYICKNSIDCLEKAYKRRALERTLKENFSREEIENIFAEVRKLAHQ